MFAGLLRSCSVAMASLALNVSEHELGRHHHRVVLSLLALGVRADRAEELAQAAWAKLLEKHGQGQLPYVELPGLAIRQARFLALDEFRRNALRSEYSLDATKLPDLTQDPRAVLIARAELERVSELLSHCRPTARAVFKLFYIDGLASAAEVAQRLGLSVQRVRQTLCEVRKHPTSRQRGRTMTEHLSDTTISLFIAGEEAESSAAAIRGHAGSCDRCASRVAREATLELRIHGWSSQLQVCRSCGAVGAAGAVGAVGAVGAEPSCRACRGVDRRLGATAVELESSSPRRKRAARRQRLLGRRSLAAASIAIATAAAVVTVAVLYPGSPEAPAVPEAASSARGPGELAASAPPPPTCAATPDLSSSDGRVSFYYPYGKDPYLCFRWTKTTPAHKAAIDLSRQTHQHPEQVKAIHVLGTPQDHRVVLVTTSEDRAPALFWRLRAFRRDKHRYLVADGFFGESLRGRDDCPPYLPREDLFGTLEFVLDRDDPDDPLTARSTPDQLRVHARPIGDLNGAELAWSWPPPAQAAATDPIGPAAPLTGPVGKFLLAARSLVPPQWYICGPDR